MTPSQFEDLLNVHRHKLVRSAIHKWGDLGEDIMQEAFLRAYENLERYDGSCTFNTWIFGFAKIIQADWLRKEQLLPMDDEVDVLDIPSLNETEHWMFNTQVLELVERLPRFQQNAFVKQVLGERSRKDREGLRRVRKTIKEVLNENSGDEG